MKLTKFEISYNVLQNLKIRQSHGFLFSSNEQEFLNKQILKIMFIIIIVVIIYNYTLFTKIPQKIKMY